MRKIVNYFKGVFKEGRRIKWPKKEVFFGALSVVLCITIFAAIFLSLEDFAANTILDELRKAFEALK